MRFLPGILALFAALAVCKIAQASPTAFDTAGDSAYNNGWTNGSNGGYGWNGGWDFKYIGTMIPTLASDPADSGIMNSPALPLGRSWELTNTNNGTTIPIVMRHIVSALQPGQVFSVDMDSPSGAIVFGFADDYSDYTVISTGPSDGTGPNQYLIQSYEAWFTGIPWTNYDTQVPVLPGPVHIELTGQSVVGSRSNFDLQITSLTTGQTETLPSLFLGVNSGPYQPDVDTFYFGGSVYLNNMSVTPEPAALSLVSLWSLLLLKRPWNKRSSAGV